MSRAEIAAQLRQEADALTPQKMALETRRTELAAQLAEVGSQQRLVGQRYSDLMNAAQALEVVK